MYVRHSPVTSTVYGANMLSPLTGPVPVARTAQEIERRASHGLVYSPVPASRAAVEPMAPAVPGGPAIDRSKDSKYWKADQALAKTDKFYGDKKHDKGVDVHTFVRAIDFQLDRWMEAQQLGRLELVISCPAGQAQAWLMNKLDDLNLLVARNVVSRENAEWAFIKNEFIEKMGGGQAERVNMTKLDTLKLGPGNDSEEVLKFISHFREYALRAYPLSKHPDTEMRSRMLGVIFEKRVKDSNRYVWAEMQRVMPRPEKLEEWEEALLSGWTVNQSIREEMVASKAGRGGFTPNGSAVSSATHRLQHAAVQSDTDSTNACDEGADTSSDALNAVVAKGSKSGGLKRENNFIDGKMAAQLIRARRCLHCYAKGHFARECTAPTNRAPTEAELKA